MKNEFEKYYDEYMKEMRKYVDAVNMKKALHVNRKGLGGIRDRFVNFKSYWTETQSYYSFAQALFLLTALVPTAILNINNALSFLGLEFDIPVGLTSFFVMVAAVGFFFFGFLSYKKFKLVKRFLEIGVSVSPFPFMTFTLFNKMNDDIKLIKEKLEIE